MSFICLASIIAYLIIIFVLWKNIEKEHLWLKTEYYDFEKNQKEFKKYKVEKSLPTFIFLNKKGKEFLRLHGKLLSKTIVVSLMRTTFLLYYCSS